ncbi:unnamed protein product [Bursaphelenchus xylophilus]|uniref:(pine wood nematode) hypothetical protein n=1 Tax=Bursaphelenchus xylophilus TaxID=6326 RepID=A0A1I7SRR8_BURXY|nr:unnamed protein product [Bursaphelenchus xylophilus]CAG9101922.1 unnamed protein product [Bursaphelenchus xylophilus]
MDYKKLPDETQSVYSQDSTLVKEDKMESDPPVYVAEPARKLKRTTRWKRFLDRNITVRQLLIILVTCYLLLIVNEELGITRNIGNAIGDAIDWVCGIGRAICRLFDHLTAPEDPIVMDPYAKWPGRAEIERTREKFGPSVAARLEFPGNYD